MAERDDQLDAEEAAFTAVVAQTLEETANEFAYAVAGAAELVTAQFSEGRISRVQGNRTRSLVRRLLGTAPSRAPGERADWPTSAPRTGPAR
ncbi:hypothetical protein ACFW9I_34575 [[Kitasatospora] papulosa]|uniref:hypothetical protein n=1 Tax=[Kitasatospora] papulosa TaxID=1464011 RepID=UPI00369559AC